jgi:glutamine amidotransferase
VRKAPLTVAHLKDQDVAVDFSSVTTSNDRVAVIATNPLTENENWTVHEPGTLLMFVEGEIVSQYKTIAGTLICDPTL